MKSMRRLRWPFFNDLFLQGRGEGHGPLGSPRICYWDNKNLYQVHLLNMKINAGQIRY